MIILYINFQSEKVVIYISICSLIMWTDVPERSCIFNNEIVFIAIWCFLNYNESSFNSWLCKILVLELLPKMFLTTNQITGFFKV